jgi:hypothetical protein
MDRRLVNVQAELPATFLVNGVPTDPAPPSANVTIVRGDGTVLINAAVATPVVGATGTFSYTLTANQNNKLDRLTATWTSALGTVVTTTEIVGGFLISSDKMVELFPGDSIDELARKRTDIEQRLEKALGYACVPRYEREAVTANRRGLANLKWSKTRLVRSYTAQNTAYGATQISQLDIDPLLGRVGGLAVSRYHGDVLLEYEHGLSYPDENVRVATINALLEKYGPNQIDGRIRSKRVDNVQVDYARTTVAAGMEFQDSNVVAFILANRRPLVR